MGWENFKGHTERVDLSKAGSGAGNFAKAFGDAFSTLGNDMINAKAQAKRDELLGLQIQNEQAKLDAAKDAKAVKKVDDAFRNDAGTLDLNVTSEAKQNAMDALKQFYNPSLEARTAQDQANSAKESVIQKQNDDTYKSMVLNAPNKQELADAWAMSDLVDRGYKPSADIVKERDNFFQGKFNDEAISVANSGGYKNMDEFSKANPELVKNADGVTMSKIDQYFSGKVKDAFDRSDKDRTYNLQEKKFNHEVSHDNQTLAIARTKAENDSDNSGIDGAPTAKNIKKNIEIAQGITNYIQDKMPYKVDEDGKRIPKTDKEAKRDVALEKYMTYAIHNGVSDINSAYNWAADRWNKENKVGSYAPKKSTVKPTANKDDSEALAQSYLK